MTLLHKEPAQGRTNGIITQTCALPLGCRKVEGARCCTSPTRRKLGGLESWYPSNPKNPLHTIDNGFGRTKTHDPGDQNLEYTSPSVRLHYMWRKSYLSMGGRGLTLPPGLPHIENAAPRSQSGQTGQRSWTPSAYLRGPDPQKVQACLDCCQCF
jgi:hypothetical protein